MKIDNKYLFIKIILIFFYLNSCITTKPKQQQIKLKQQNSLKQFYERQKLLVRLISSNQNKIIPIIRQSSCQLIIFVFHNNSFNIKIQQIPQQINLIRIQLKSLNKIIQKQPLNSIVQIYIQIYEQNENQFQITEYLKIIAINTKQTYRNIKQIQYKYNYQYQQQQQQYYQQQNVQFYQIEQIFVQLRKVYLIKCSHQDWSVVILPQRAIIITQVLAFIMIILLSHNIKYRRFTPLNFGWIFAIVYSFIIFLVVYIDLIINSIFPSQSVNINDLNLAKYILGFISSISIFIYTQDIFNMFLQKKRIILPLSFIFSITIILLDIFILEDYWYINNIIAILISGCVIKFIVIRKLKNSILPLTLLWIFSILRQFVSLQTVVQQISLQIFTLNLQIPACFGDDQDGYSCSAFGVSKIIIIGLIINYSIRIDLFISTKFYQISNLIIAFISLLIELAINYISDQIPMMEYLSIAIFLPLSIIFMLILANKRGQWAIVWHGSFYDMAVNRTSIRKGSESITSIEEDFGNSLKLSKTLFSDNSYISN